MTEERFLLEKKEMDELLDKAKRTSVQDIDDIIEEFEKEFAGEFFKETVNG